MRIDNSYTNKYFHVIFVNNPMFPIFNFGNLILLRTTHNLSSYTPRHFGSLDYNLPSSLHLISN